MKRVLVTGGSIEARRMVAGEISDYFDLPRVELGGHELLAIGKLAVDDKWVASGLVSPRRVYQPLRRRLIDMADKIVAVPSIPEHFVPFGQDFNDSPEAQQRYYASIKAGNQLVQDAKPVEALVLDIDPTTWTETIHNLNQTTV